MLVYQRVTIMFSLELPGYMCSKVCTMYIDLPFWTKVTGTGLTGKIVTLHLKTAAGIVVSPAA